MLTRGETVGVFQVESAGMRRALVDMQPDRFEDLIALVALYRPGPDGEYPDLLRPQARPGEGRVSASAAGADPRADLRGHHLPGAGAADRAGTWPAIRWPRPICCAAPWARRSSRRWTRSAAASSRARPSTASTGTPADHDLRRLRQVRRVRLQQVPLGALCLHHLPDGLAEGALPGEFMAASMTLDMDNTDKLTEFRREAPSSTASPSCRRRSTAPASSST